MEISAVSLLSDLRDIDKPFVYDPLDIMDFLDEELLRVDQCENFQTSSAPINSSDSNSNFWTSLLSRSESTTLLCAPSLRESTQLIAERPAKQHKPNSYNSSANPIILSFDDPTRNVIQKVLPQQEKLDLLNRSPKTSKKSGGRVRDASQTYDRITAERNRREQLSQGFIALSALVPGLKKMDKTSILGDTIKYLKQMQERVKTLEERPTNQKTESFVLVSRSQKMGDDVEGSTAEIENTDQVMPLPDIQAKVCHKSILLKIHCEKHKNVLINLLTEVESLNLVVSSISVAPFGRCALDITLMAEMQKLYNLPMKEMIGALQSALRRPE